MKAATRRYLPLGLAAGSMLVALNALTQTFNLLHSFVGSEGAYPHGSLILSNGMFYGMTSGDVFRMNVSGSGCTNLHAFSAYGGNGKDAYAAVTLAGGQLYGMTVGGGMGLGVVFRVNTDGTGYTNLHVFSRQATNGSMPYGSLTMVDGRLFGMTARGGSNDLGTLFEMGADGRGYTNSHVFSGGATDGAYPMGDLTLGDKVFYGMTTQGGANNLGTVFRVGIDGSGYTNLHSFAGYPTDGVGPPGSLTLEGGTLYGMTQQGGTNTQRLGIVFKMNTDGSGYTTVHSFAGGANDGATPLGSPTLANGALYGMTSVGGASNHGVVFRVDTDGNGYTNLHAFTAAANDGASPHGSLTWESGTLYGMTYYGGTNNRGVVFALSNLPERPTSLTLVHADNRVVVSWPISASGWTLQTNSGLGSGAWGVYQGPTGHHTVTNTPTTANLFFRLAK